MEEIIKYMAQLKAYVKFIVSIPQSPLGLLNQQFIVMMNGEILINSF
jgi:hypothetical protein